MHLQAASLPHTEAPVRNRKDEAEKRKQIILGGVASVGREEAVHDKTDPDLIQRGTAQEARREQEEAEDQTTSLMVYDNTRCVGKPKNSFSVQSLQRYITSPPEFPLSVKVVGGGVAEVFILEREHYQGVIIEGDGCFRFPSDMIATLKVKFTLYGSSNQQVSFKKQQIPASLQKQFTTAPDISKPHTKIVFSAQSSHYFGYQVLANAYAFLQSNQTNASWIRLITSRTPDDLSQRFPTFSAPKCLDSRFYNPLNKADVIQKWFLSPDAPHPDDTIIVVDPDSWLLKDLHPWTVDVSHGNAVGQQAYYFGQKLCQDLWKEICIENCGHNMDLVGVPYLLKARDLEAIAPLWKKYSMIVKKKLLRDEFKRKYSHLGFDWAAEMIGYNAACTHLNIKTKIVDDLQVRDIESDANLDRWSKVPSIHVGRAWFPIKDAEMAAPWRDEDDGGMNRGKRIQVWCKCNITAGEQQPWPIPTTGMDFASKHTLTLLHDSLERFGPVPVNESFRWQDDYYKTAP